MAGAGAVFKVRPAASKPAQLFAGLKRGASQPRCSLALSPAVRDGGVCAQEAALQRGDHRPRGPWQDVADRGHHQGHVAGAVRHALTSAPAVLAEKGGAKYTAYGDIDRAPEGASAAAAGHRLTLRQSARAASPSRHRTLSTRRRSATTHTWTAPATPTTSRT